MMRNLSLALVFLSAALLRCGNEVPRSVEIRITSGAKPNSQAIIKISDLFALRDSILFSGITDSSGRLKISIPLPSPTFAFMEVSGIESAIYLEPGYDLVVAAANRPEQITRYSGEGSVINNYLAEAVRLKSSIQNADGKDLYSLAPTEFLKRMQSLRSGLGEFLESYVDSIDTDDETRALMDDWNSIVVDTYRQTYGFNYRNQNNFKTDTSLFDIRHFRFNEKFLQQNQRDLGYFLTVHMQEDLYGPLYYDVEPEQLSSFEARLPLVVDSIISHRSYPEKIREYLLARNIEFLVSTKGLSKGVETTNKNFRSRYPHSPYHKYLEKSVNKWLAISAGKIAPDIRAVMVDQTSFSLTQLKGKVIYVDVWATWCGPCLVEKPHLKKLQKRFASTDSVAFLAVSVDRDRAAWKKMVTGEEGWGGIHVIQGDQDATPEILESYNISGIPRYILIDREGRIVSANAERPSSGDVIYSKIKSLL